MVILLSCFLVVLTTCFLLLLVLTLLSSRGSSHLPGRFIAPSVFSATCMSKMNEFSRSEAVTFTSDVVVSTKRYQIEAFEKCWVHSPLRAAARPFTRCSHCRTRASMSTTTTTTMTTMTTTTRDRGDRYGPIMGPTR